MNAIDLNADLGEGGGYDHLLMPLITSANIACAGHAGDEETVRRSIELALQNGVNIGAHPGFADKENFGRNRLALSDNELSYQITAQLNLFQKIAGEFNATARYVKLHGAMANMAAEDFAFALKAYSVVKSVLPNTPILAIANSEQVRAAEQLDISFFTEAFADRAYMNNGQLAPRSLEGAVLHNEADVLAQVQNIVANGKVSAITGEQIQMRAQSICVHGDNQHALLLVKAIRNALEAQGINVIPFIQPEARKPQ